MGASIDCLKEGGKQVDIECCQNCFFKRLDSDYSLTWCRYKRYQANKMNRKKLIENAEIKIKALKIKQTRLYKTGKVRLAQALEQDISKVKKSKEINLMINKAIAKITEEALEINNPAVTAIEEFLTNHCKTEEYAKALLNQEKTLKGCWNEITKKAREKAVSGTAVLSSEEVFGIVEKYFEIEKTSDSYKSKVVNILDVL